MDLEQILAEYGDTATAVADILYGDAYEISKAASDAAESQRKRDLMQTRLSQASNAVGLAAGVAATPGAIKDTKSAYKAYKAEPKTQNITSAPRPKFKMRAIPGTLKRMSNGSKAKLAIAGGNLGLQALNLGGDALTNVVLRRTAQEKQGVSKSGREDFGVYCEISKVDTDKRQVFGWASISKKDGAVVQDLQGDTIDTDELERAAYNYILNSRKGGHEHQKNADNTPVHVADIIESFVVTPEKKQALGLPEDMPEGWWVGMKVHDDEVWELAKSGELAGFSVHGSGRRVAR